MCKQPKRKLKKASTFIKKPTGRMDIHITPRYTLYNSAVEPVKLISVHPKRKRRKQKTQVPVALPVRREKSRARPVGLSRVRKLDIKENSRRMSSPYQTPKTVIKRPNIVSLWFTEWKIARENKEDSKILRDKVKEWEKWKKKEEKELKKKEKALMKAMPVIENRAKSSPSPASVFKKEKPIIIERPKSQYYSKRPKKPLSERFVNCFYKFCCQLYCWCTIIIILVGLFVYFV